MVSECIFISSFYYFMHINLINIFYFKYFKLWYIINMTFVNINQINSKIIVISTTYIFGTRQLWHYCIKLIFNSLNIDSLHGHIHGWSCKKYENLLWDVNSLQTNTNTCIRSHSTIPTMRNCWVSNKFACLLSQITQVQSPPIREDLKLM